MSSITALWEWIPDWILQGLNFGQAYPEGSEDDLFDLGDAWKQAGAELEQIEPDLKSVTDATQKFYTGDGATAAAREFATLFDNGPNSIQKLADGLTELGHATRNAGTTLEYTKIQEAVFAGITAYTVYTLIASWPWGEAAVPLALAAGREAVTIAGEQGARQLALEAGAVGLRNLLKPYLRQIAIAGLKAGGFGIGLDVGIQGYQLAAGHRDDGFDLSQTLKTGLEFGAAGLVGAPVSMGLGNLLGRTALSPTLSRLFSHTLGGAAGGLGMYGAGIAWQVGGQLAHGGLDWSKIDTSFDPRLLTMGAAMGAMGGLHAPAPRGARGTASTGGESPLTASEKPGVVSAESNAEGKLLARSLSRDTHPDKFDHLSQSEKDHAAAFYSKVDAVRTDATTNGGYSDQHVARLESLRTEWNQAMPYDGSTAHPSTTAHSAGETSATTTESRAGSADSSTRATPVDRAPAATTDSGGRAMPSARNTGQVAAERAGGPRDTTANAQHSTADGTVARAGLGDPGTSDRNANIAAAQQEKPAVSGVESKPVAASEVPESRAAPIESPVRESEPAIGSGEPSHSRPPTDTAVASDEAHDRAPADPGTGDTHGLEGDWMQSGGALRPRDPGFDDAWAAEAYDRFRRDDADVAEISSNLARVPRADGSTGFSRSEIAQIKNHLMRDEHLLHDYDSGGFTRARFDPSAAQAEAWIRLRAGRPLEQDLIMLEHELAESNYLREHPEATYPEAHVFANQRYNWETDIPDRTGERYDTLWKDDNGAAGVLRPGTGGHDSGRVPVRDDRGQPGSKSVDRQADPGIPHDKQPGRRPAAGDGRPDTAPGSDGRQLAEGRNHPVLAGDAQRSETHRAGPAALDPVGRNTKGPVPEERRTPGQNTPGDDPPAPAQKTRPAEYVLTDDQIQQIFHEQIIPEMLTGAERVPESDRPELVVVGGQMGAGKSTAIRQLLDSFEGRGGAVHLTADDFFRFHPKYAELMAGTDHDGVRHITPEIGRWFRMSMDHAIANRYHVVLEFALAKPAAEAEVMRNFVSHGYTAKAEILAVSEHQSRLSTISRYLDEREDGVHRYTPPFLHDASYAGSEEMVRQLESPEPPVRLDDLKIRDRNGVLHGNSRSPEGNWTHPHQAAETLDRERNRPWTEDEKNNFRGQLRSVRDRLAQQALDHPDNAHTWEQLSRETDAAETAARPWLEGPDDPARQPSGEPTPLPPDEDLAIRQAADKAGLRILVMIDEWGRAKGGIVSFNTDFSTALAEAGNDVTVRVDHDVTGNEGGSRLRIVGPPRIEDASDRAALPPDVDVVIGHSRFSGFAAREVRDELYPDAKLIHIVHMINESDGRVKGRPAEGLRLQQMEMDLVSTSDVAVGVGPAIAEDVHRLANMSESDPIVHELIPGVPFAEQIPPREGEGPLKVLLVGRADSPRKGVLEGAEMVRLLNERGLDVDLIVRGVPPEQVARTQHMLSEAVGRLVDIRPYTTDPADILSDLRDSNIMIMPSRGEHFGLVGTEAMGAGVPVLLPSTSGVGRFLGDPNLFPGNLTRHSLVEQGFEDEIPIERWVDRLEHELRDQPGSWERARRIQDYLREQNRTWLAAAESLLEALAGPAEVPRARNEEQEET
ncbi:zeta toxin family protein [Nocardia pseudovaccinii]|uniref:zeta toxin family protein n=1 Tax=Nocardia pseudovaccinii TaxID=189540 RepID=UPI0007A46A0C|nr:zeta toxin family protein [Nocardia pseudovaccinii]